MGWKHRLGTEGENTGRGNTGWELSVESTSTGENGMETQAGN